MSGKQNSPGVDRGCFLLMAGFALLMAVSGWKFASCVLEDRQERRFVEELRARAVTVKGPETPPAGEEPAPTPELPPITVDLELLQAENPDVIAWIYCPDTEVNYPVLQSEDNSYYLRRRSDGTYHIAGSIFADYRNAADLSDENVILYGHNMSGGSMFALLPSYADQAFYEAHPVWYLLTPTANYRVELFAGFVTSTQSPVYSVQREKAEDGRPITEQAWEESGFRGVSPPEKGERTITLSTCSYEFSGARYVLMGILREMGL